MGSGSEQSTTPLEDTSTLRISTSSEAPEISSPVTTNNSSILCSACSAPTSKPRTRNTNSEAVQTTLSQASENTLSQEVDENSSDESEEELPPPADPNAPARKKSKRNTKHISKKTELKELLGQLRVGGKNLGEEEKIVRERASKLEFKRLDEL